MGKYKFLIGFLSLTLTLSLSAQDFSKYKEINLSDSKSCSIAQEKVIECCDYLLNTPCVDNLPSLNALTFIIKWMGATPDFIFSLNDRFYKSIDSDLNLTSRYYASLAKTAIEYNYHVDNIDLQLKAITVFVEYCELPKNKVKITRKLQKYIDAKKSGNLRDLIEK